MPALSPTMSEGNIISWSKKEGDKVKVGDIICEIQTDKATIGFESQEDGYLAKILIPGESKGVEVGKLIGLLVEEKDEIKTLDVSKYTSPSPAAPKKDAAPAAKPDISKVDGAPAGSTVGKAVAGKGWEVKDKSGKLIGYVQQ